MVLHIYEYRIDNLLYINFVNSLHIKKTLTDVTFM